jgi:GH18 family chitinase
VQENDIQYKNDVLQADYVKANGVGGSMVWAMDLDDIHGVCGFGKNPLMSKLKEILTNGNVVTQSPTTVITNSPTQLTTGVITNSPTHVPTSDVNRPSTQTHQMTTKPQYKLLTSSLSEVKTGLQSKLPHLLPR